MTDPANRKAARIYEHDVLSAIDTITSETGYPPDAEELADAIGCIIKQIHSALAGAKHRGEIRYDDTERFVHP